MGNLRPPQEQHERPGRTAPMMPKPMDEMEEHKSAGRFKDKVAVVTGGDSGIGRAAAIGLAKEGAKVAILYLQEHDDAEHTKKIIENNGGEALLVAADISERSQCEKAVAIIVERFQKIDVLCNNAGEQHPQTDISGITEEQLRQTFSTNIFAMFFLTQLCLPYMRPGSSIVNISSVTAYAGNPQLLDYSSTKGAITSFTRSLALNLAEKDIRVNAVAPGPIWTPLIPSTFPADKVANFGM